MAKSAHDSYMARHYCSRIKDIPKVDHFVIITQGSAYTPADQRSIDFPGHGYPASTDYHLNYMYFLDREDWEDYISEETAKGKASEFTAIAVKVPKVTMKTTVTVD